MGCECFYVKYKFDKTIERYKAHLVAKAYTQTQCIDYMETLALIAKLNTIQVIFSNKFGLASSTA